MILYLMEYVLLQIIFKTKIKFAIFIRYELFMAKSVMNKKETYMIAYTDTNTYAHPTVTSQHNRI